MTNEQNRNGNGSSGPSRLHGLPEVAGLCSFEAAMKPGLGVEDCVARIKRYHYSLRRLHEILTGRIPSEPVYELKMAFGHHAHLCAEHVTAFAERVGEMRQPPLGLDKVPDPNLELFFDEIRNAPTTAELLVGVYGKALPALKEGLERHIAETNSLVDAPTVRLCRFALLEVNDMVEYGRRALPCIVSDEDRTAMGEWVELLDSTLWAAGSLDGSQVPRSVDIAPKYAAAPYEFDGETQRDERFVDVFNMGVNAEEFIYDEEMPDRPKALMLLFKRLREIDVPEMMAGIIVETPDKPWEYYRDLARQLWDEARHAMMGEVGFEQLGIDWRKARINHTFSYGLNTLCKPIERHAVLYFIEQGLMSKTGKRFEYELSEETGNPFLMLCQDYDWADEVLHARIGRDWYVSEIGDPAKANEYGDECWSRTFAKFGAWKEQGLTQHENWWPEFYRHACEVLGWEVDPKVLAYSKSYESTRADLKSVTGSA